MSENNNDNTDIIFQKEKEWRDLLLTQLDKTKTERNQAESYLNEIKEKYIQMEIDFKHNLKLLNERDKDLNELEEENIMLRESMYENEDKISMLSVAIDKLKEDLKVADDVKLELREKLQHVANKSFSDIQSIRNDKIREIERLKDENAEKVKFLERKIIQMESETRENQFSLMADVEETLRNREGELKRKTEEVHSEMLNYELKYRLASKELDLSRSSKAEVIRKLTVKEDIIRELEMKLGELELAHQSEISIEIMKRETEALHAREKEINLSKEIEKLARKLDDRKNTLKNKVDLAKRLEGEIKQVLENGRQNEREKEKENENLKSELEKLLQKIDEMEKAIENEHDNVQRKDSEICRLVGRITEETAKKDGEMRSMRLQMDSLVQQLKNKQDELLELRNELEYAIGRDLELSRQKVGDRETWQSQLEKVRIEEMSKVESMIKTITKTRDDSLAEVRELRKQLEERKIVRLCDNCSKESGKYNDEKVEHETITKLNQQNQQLKDIIAQMTEETTKQVYEQSQKNQPTEIISNNKHIASLAERNRQLQQEKIELLATSRKFQARLEATESDNINIKRKLRESETEISQVKYELDSLQRHTGMDVRTMRRTMQELETELSVSRKEAEEYYKGNLELGRVIEDLQSELTFLKSEQIDKFPTLNFGAQEMLIEQLKKEINELRNKLMYTNPNGNESDYMMNRKENTEMVMLQKKLKAAANHIKNLASEKQVLIQISNRLRSELKAAGIKIPSGGNHGKHSTECIVENDGNKDIKRTINDLEEKLSKLEQLQKNLKSNFNENQSANHQLSTKSAREVGSSVGRHSVDEVFKLLDDSDSLGQSSIIGNTINGPLLQTKEADLLWSKSMKLNTIQSRPKRNMVTNR